MNALEWSKLLYNQGFKEEALDVVYGYCCHNRPLRDLQVLLKQSVEIDLPLDIQLSLLTVSLWNKIELAPLRRKLYEKVKSKNKEEDCFVGLELFPECLLIGARTKEEELDIIFNWFYAKFQEKEYDKCDMFLSEMPINLWPMYLLIGVLSITFTQRDFLKRRGIACQQIRDRIQRERPNDEDGLLRGLA